MLHRNWGPGKRKTISGYKGILQNKLVQVSNIVSLRSSISLMPAINQILKIILYFQTITIPDALIAEPTFQILNVVCTINPNLFSYSIWKLLDTNLINLRHESKCVNGKLPKADTGHAEPWLIVIGIKTWLAWGVVSLAFIVRSRPPLPNKASVKCLVLAKTWP